MASSGNVHVRVVFSDERNAGPNLLVELMSGASNNPIMKTYTNDIGETQFVGVRLGEYHIEVSGDGIQRGASEQFEVDSRKVAQSQYVVVNRVENPASSRPLSARSPMVSAADLKVPDKARKEVDKANEAMAQHNWKKAQEHLEKAVALAPQYVTAYNNLGVLYDKVNDIPKEEEALSKAVEFDGHFAPALVNYGKLSLRQKDPVKAEALLQKASVSDPGNPETLMLLAYAQYINRHFEPAISNALQAHSSGSDHASFVHYIAARSYQQESQTQQAIAQFQVFLTEEPKGPRADHVREDVAKLRQGQQASAQ
jgi:tetratricopeptide (TPR) repeat protein